MIKWSYLLGITVVRRNVLNKFKKYRKKASIKYQYNLKKEISTYPMCGSNRNGNKKFCMIY